MPGSKSSSTSAEDAHAHTVLVKTKSRNSYKGCVTKEMTKATKLLAAKPLDFVALRTSHAKLMNYHSIITELTSTIRMNLSDETAIDDDIASFDDYVDTLLDFATNILSIVTEAKETAAAAASLAAATGIVPTAGTSTSTVDKPTVRLPTLSIPPFSGDIMKWQEFWDIFNSTVHKRTDIDPVEKFKFLRGYLVGPPLTLTEGYTLTNDSYENVISVLKDRYGDTEVAIFFHFDSMLALPVAGNSVTELQQVCDECEMHIRSLSQLGLAETTFGRVFSLIMLTKMPATVREELYRAKGGGEWTLAKLRELLKIEVYARDMSNRTFGQNNNGGRQLNNYSQRSENFRGTQKWQRRQNTGTAFMSAGNAAPRKTESARGRGGYRATTRQSPSCSFCSGSHYSDKCQQYRDHLSRREQMKGKGCFSCLGGDHIARFCPSKKPCYYCKETRHHQALCPVKFPAPESAGGGRANMISAGDKAEEKSKNVTASLISQGRRGILQTAVTTAVGRHSATSRVLLDTGADTAFITFDLVKRINPRYLGSERLSIAGFESSDRRPKLYRAYEFKVVLRDGRKKAIKAYGTESIIPRITKYALSSSNDQILSQVALAEPPVSTNEQVTVDVCLGSDYYYEIVKPKRIPLEEKGLYLLDSEFGYVVAGSLQSRSKTSTHMLISRGSTATTVAEPAFDLERFWRLEEIGIHDRPETTEDEIAVKIFNDTVQFNSDDNRYEVKWPLKQPMPDLPSNFKMSLARLKSMLAQIGKEPELVKKYQDTFDGQIEKSVIEEAPEVPDGDTIHYLPHHPVLTPDKVTTKLRVVYDASSKAFRMAPCLNDCVYRGPVVLEDLCGLLMRFRTKRVGIVSDIEKAFLQIGLQKPDRDLVRFLWVKDVTKPPSGDNLVHMRFARVCFGVNASPWLLAATLLYHLKRVGTPVAEDIMSNIYVDNIIGCKDGTADAMSYYTEAKSIFNACSMNLREWYSNDETLMSQIPECDRGKQSFTKVLGVTWDLPSDTLACSVGSQTSCPLTSKRTVLRTLAQTFDPCGFLAPVSAPGKWLMQELWQKKYGWDDKLPDEFRVKWKPYFDDLKRLSECRIPRCYFLSDVAGDQSYDLHCFCDASIKAYSAVVYLCAADVGCASLVFAKCRVSPLKTETVPRLELLAATCGSRLLNYVESELRLPIRKRFLWSDSKCVLHWIVGKPVSTIFVKNRVGEIRKLKNVEFRYVPTAENPADLPTRGVSFEGFADCSLWWHGPKWLVDVGSWPEPFDSAPGRDSNVTTEPDATVTVGRVVPDEPPDDTYLFNPSGVSSLSKLLRVTGWVMRFVNNARKPQADREVGPYLSVSELKSARLLWDKSVQSHHFGDVVASGGKKLGSLRALGSVFVDATGLIRVSTRLDHADVPDSAKRPAILPKQDPYTRLIIQNVHAQLMHAGVKQTLAELRYEYWVVQGRAQVKKVISQCLDCRRRRGGPFVIPQQPALPEFRVKQRRPFAHVGLDYLGPLLIDVPGGKPEKVWICLFTCAVSRAVYLEVVDSMSSVQFLLAFRRFMAVYGTPELVVLDNASQFVTTRRVLDKVWLETCQSIDVQEFSAGKGISWKFIVEAAPWMGGFYERLVGCVKNSLKAAVDRKRLSYVELQTVVSEVAAVVNSRPLLYAEEEVGDFPLTPSHLILRHPSIYSLAPGDDEPQPNSNSTQAQLIASWRRIQCLLNSFWTIWRKSYLTGLQEQVRSRKQRGALEVSPKIGAVVLIADDHLPRSQWRIGRITELIASADGLCRSVKLFIPGGRYINRPIKLLFPLELSVTEPLKVDKTNLGVTDKTDAANFNEVIGLNKEDRAVGDNPAASVNGDAVNIDGGQNDEHHIVGPGGDSGGDDPPTPPKIAAPSSGRVRRDAARRALRQIKSVLQETDGVNESD